MSKERAIKQCLKASGAAFRRAQKVASESGDLGEVELHLHHAKCFMRVACFIQTAQYARAYAAACTIACLYDEHREHLPLEFLKMNVKVSDFRS